MGEPDAAKETQARHARYYASFIDSRLHDLMGGRQKVELSEIDVELNNIRAAWQYAVEQKEWDAVDKALEGLHLFCDMQGRYLEGVALWELATRQLSAVVDAMTRPVLGRLLSRYRFMQVFSPSDPDGMETDLNISLNIAREQNDPLETAF